MREEVQAGSEGEEVLAWGGAGRIMCEMPVQPLGGGGQTMMVVKLAGDRGVGGQPSEM